MLGRTADDADFGGASKVIPQGTLIERPVERLSVNTRPRPKIHPELYAVRGVGPTQPHPHGARHLRPGESVPIPGKDSPSEGAGYLLWLRAYSAVV